MKFWNIAPYCSVVAAIVFPWVLPCPSVSSHPRNDGSSDVVGFGALSSVQALSNPSSNEARLRSSAKGSMLFSLLVSALPVC